MMAFLPLFLWKLSTLGGSDIPSYADVTYLSAFDSKLLWSTLAVWPNIQFCFYDCLLVAKLEVLLDSLAFPTDGRRLDWWFCAAQAQIPVELHDSAGLVYAGQPETWEHSPASPQAAAVQLVVACWWQAGLRRRRPESSLIYSLLLLNSVGTLMTECLQTLTPVTCLLSFLYPCLKGECWKPG